jgi:hypothetical protein
MDHHPIAQQGQPETHSEMGIYGHENDDNHPDLTCSDEETVYDDDWSDFGDDGDEVGLIAYDYVARISPSLSEQLWLKFFGCYEEVCTNLSFHVLIYRQVLEHIPSYSFS